MMQAGETRAPQKDIGHSRAHACKEYGARTGHCVTQKPITTGFGHVDDDASSVDALLLADEQTTVDHIDNYT